MRVIVSRRGRAGGGAPSSTWSSVTNRWRNETHGLGHESSPSSDLELDPFWIIDLNLVPIPHRCGKRRVPVVKEDTNSFDAIGNSAIYAHESLASLHCNPE